MAGIGRRRILAALTALAGFDRVAATVPDRAALLAGAEAALEHGEPLAALDDFERAALIVHAPDAELGSIRAAMQSGQYRRALAFCAHAAGEHLEAAEPGALYAWLLRAGGQPALADRVLGETLDRHPDAAVPCAVRDAFRADLPVAAGVLLAPPQRMAPWPSTRAGETPPASARVLPGGAVLVGDGTRALAPRASLPAGRLWVRNGLGETAAVLRREPPDDPVLASTGLVILRLVAPLDAGVATEAAEPYAGSPGHALRFAPGGIGWPWLAQGFLGAIDGATGLRRLGFGAGVGAAVLDGRGQLAGLVVAAPPDGPTLWLPAARWQAALGARAAERSPPARALVAPDAVYEAGLRRPLQLIAG